MRRGARLSRQRGKNRRAELLFLVVVLAGLTQSKAFDTIEFFERWENQLGVVYDELERRLVSSDEVNCNCSRLACGNGMDSEATCVEYENTAAKLCSNGECSLAKDIAFGTFPENLKKDICLTEGLEESYKEARNYTNGIEPWTYFGTSETGMFRIWPGSPRENKENSRECNPYDPRVRPWWAVAARKPRNLIIMIDMSKRMQENIYKKPIKKWELTMNMTMQLLDTLSEQDMVNVIIYDINATTLLNFDILMKADETTIKRLKKGLRALTPTWGQTLDIAEALDLAFKVFRNYPRDPAPEFAKCENHIVLFSDNRDCVKSQWPNCSLRERNNLEKYARIENATEWFLYFADTLKEEMRRLRGTRVSLYPFSLSPHASSWMSQLACRLDGIHVDLAKELDKGIIDPLMLMKGYFTRIALPIATISEKPKMVISPKYEDDGGLGEMNTFAMPVFYQTKPKCPPLLYGVIGTDMPLSKYSEEGIQIDKSSFDLERSNWNGDHASCSSEEEVSRCHLQSLRGTDNQCVYRKDNRKESKCFKYNNNYYYLEESRARRFEQARDFCENDGGYMITPKKRKERRVLTSILPPDGVWINLKYNNTQWYWPDNEQLNANQAENLDRFRAHEFSVLAIMDPHSYEQNFQWAHELSFQYTMCKYEKKPPSYLCSDENTTTLVDNDEALDTIKSCGMEDCTLENVPGLSNGAKSERDILCNPRTAAHSFKDAACCTQEELPEECRAQLNTNSNNNGTDNSDGGINSIAVVILSFLIVLVILMSFVVLYAWRYWSYRSGINSDKARNFIEPSIEQGFELARGRHYSNLAENQPNDTLANPGVSTNGHAEQRV